MKRRYALHPMEFAIGETEQFYSEMAAKGWFLEKRGAWFSRFRRGEPAAMRYRVELADLRFLDPDHGLPEEQISVYEECGWKYVTGHGLFHIFSSPTDSDAPEFYTDPRQQALVLRGLRRSYVSSWILLIVIFAINILLLLRQPYLRQLVGKLVPCVCIGYRHCAGTGGGVVLGIVPAALWEHPHRTAVPPSAQRHSHEPHPQKEELVL